MRILVVDDDAGARLVVHAMVTALGHACLLAENGRQAWEMLGREPVDVVITDRVMPDLDGLELCRRIRAATPATSYVYVVLASALGEDAHAREGMLAGADDYLTKPVRPAQLELTLIAADRVTALHRRLGRLNDDLRRQAASELAINQQLIQANQLQADMMAMLGHDIRQPLTLILGYTQSVLDFWEGDCPDLPRSRLLKAVAAARRLDALIADVLTLARVDSGTIECRTTRTVLADVLPEVLAEVLDETVPDHEVQVHGDAGAAVLVDPWHLRQIVQNLLDNAVKYGRPPFEVTVQAGAEHVTLSVRDHGDGVADDVAGRLFERFARGGAAVVTGSPGSGLGLYLVRRLVEANGGTVEHVPAGGGACLQITLPRG